METGNKYFINGFMNKTVKLNKKLYKLKAICGAVKDFGDLADFKIKKNSNNHYLVELNNIHKEAQDKIVDEFCNYVLYLMKRT